MPARPLDLWLNRVSACRSLFRQHDNGDKQAGHHSSDPVEVSGHQTIVAGGGDQLLAVVPEMTRAGGNSGLVGGARGLFAATSSTDHDRSEVAFGACTVTVRTELK